MGAVPNCVSVPKCSPVARQECNTISRAVPETVCVPKPVTTCNTVTRAVPDTKCVAKPVTQCRAVPFPVTVAVPRELCQPVARQVARQECALYKEAAHYGYGHAAKLIS